MSHKYYEALIEAATSIAIKAGAITECEFHEGVYIDLYNDNANKKAYAIASKMLKNELSSFDRDDLLREIQKVISEASDECYACQNEY